MKYSFYDDYSEGAHPEILSYIAKNSHDQQLGYSEDQYCALASERIRAAFAVPTADVHFVPNGTIANIVGLVSMLRPFEGIIAPESGHINTHEAGALEAAGHKILWMEAPNGKLNPEHIAQALVRYENEHTVVPKVVYLTQVTELGTVYTKAELESIIQYSHEQGLYVYLDGARLASALASKEADISLPDFGQLGLDMFYLGGTKNGGLFGEAMVILNDELKPYFRNHLKQRGALMAKGRVLGQQFARFFAEDNLWLNLAEHANQQATTLYQGLIELGVEFDLPSGTNQIFPILNNDVIEILSKEYGFHQWQNIDSTRTKIRLVCSWATSNEAVSDFVNSAKLLLDSSSSGHLDKRSS